MSKATAPLGRDDGPGIAVSIHVSMPSIEKYQELVKWCILSDQLHGFCSHAPPTSAGDPWALQHAGISLQWRAHENLLRFARLVRFSTQCRPFVHCCVLDFVCSVPSLPKSTKSLIFRCRVSCKMWPQLQPRLLYFAPFVAEAFPALKTHLYYHG